jgi:hypothetical protein
MKSKTNSRCLNSNDKCNVLNLQRVKIPASTLKILTTSEGEYTTLHTCVECLNKGRQTITMDSPSNSGIDAPNHIEIFKTHKMDTAINFYESKLETVAGFK